jgi:hypothetical protein
MSATQDTRADPIADFFAALNARGHVPEWIEVTGKLRVEIVDGGRTDTWSITIDKGDVSVSHGGGEERGGMRTGVGGLRVDKTLLERLIRGETNAMAAVLRGAASPDGDLQMELALQRIFPGPPNQERPAPIGRSMRWEP